MVDNATSWPITIYGEALPGGAELRVAGLKIPTTRIDARHLTALLPPISLPPAEPRRTVDVALHTSTGRLLGTTTVIVVNNAHYPRANAMTLLPDGRAAVAITHADTLALTNSPPPHSPSDSAAPPPDSSRAPSAAPPTSESAGSPSGFGRVAVGDGPVDVAAWGGRLVSVHRFGVELFVDTAPAVEIGRFAERVLVRGDTAWISERWRDTVVEVDLAGRRVVRRLPAGVDPGALALAEASEQGGGTLLVGTGTGDVLAISLADGATKTHRPRPGIPIRGGATAPLSRWVMGGRAPTAIAFAESSGLAYVASAGPNIGPNPQRWEVSMNGGVTVLDPERGFTEHFSMLRGVPADLALDDARGLLYIADEAAGRIVVMTLDGNILGGALPEPKGAALLRPIDDFGVGRRNPVSLHTGPFRLGLRDGELAVLLRFTGEVARFDVTEAASGSLVETGRQRVVAAIEQTRRALGEVAYRTDVANTQMTCDTCHPRGRAEGVLFTKKDPMRIYRSPPVAGTDLSPPYFTPALMPTMRVVARRVLDRNRYHDATPLKSEVEALAEYARNLVAPPNPWRLARGGDLSDEAARGMAVFESRAECAECHPAPAFTTDTNPATRGRLFDVGTPMALPLRLRLQDRIAAPSGAGPLRRVGRVSAAHEWRRRNVGDARRHRRRDASGRSEPRAGTVRVGKTRGRSGVVPFGSRRVARLPALALRGAFRPISRPEWESIPVSGRKTGIAIESSVGNH